jgi:hypothetical protein
VRDLEKASCEKKRMTEILGDGAVKDRLVERFKARSREGVHFCTMSLPGSEIERPSFNGQVSPNNKNVLNLQARHGI